MFIDQPSLASFFFCSSSVSIYLTICLILSCSFFSLSDCYIFTGTDVVEGRNLLPILSHFGNLTEHITNFHQVDRVYLSTPTKIAIINHEKRRTFVLRKESMPDAGSFNLIGWHRYIFSEFRV
ncbi:hypothetical protein C5167_014608 [Papaver somniferum]|uniref:Uncharacterized protein n=1 Tax=Papaver somniferum TaxID=3469 RepID=A0A4Y7J4M4_PAPSO|nr:hypothetical protein C5167_014608 [Papaver somniferum]